MSEPESKPIRRPKRGSVIRDGIIIGLTQAIILVLILFGVTIVAGNQQQHTLTDIRNATRAQVCVLLLPVGPTGRSEGQTNSRCLVPNGIAPVDANGDGQIEFEGGGNA